jgi:hypothetical protein
VSLTLAACGGEGGGSGSTGGFGNGNLAPIIEGSPVTTLAAGSNYSFTPKAADPNGDALTFSITNKPGWANFDSTTGALTGTPGEANVGKSGTITIEVSDSKAIAQLPGFQIDVVSSATVPGTNAAPTIVGTPGTAARVGQVYTFTPVGDDPDDDSLTFAIENRPSWATFTAATGELRGTPSSADVGTTSGIVIRVTDGNTTVSLPPFNLTVSAASTPPANRPPTISGTPSTRVTAGQAYSFRPVGSDPDGNTLRYSITNQPNWASFSTTTGRLSGTPNTANVGTSGSIVISVSDGTATTSLPSFMIQVVAAANRLPTISGTPTTSVAVGRSYSFQPTGSDPDGNALTWRIDNKPGWATFNTSTGRLTGTPAAGDVGTSGAIVISVSDGTGTVSLSAFTINVLAAATGSVTVSWLPPTTNTDGSTLIDLEGYRVAYGRAADDLDESVDLANPGLTTYTISNLTSGQWFFAVYAINSAGMQSDLSNVATKTIP